MDKNITNFYVYAHLIDGKIFYIGSKYGKNKREYDTTNRPDDWYEIVNKNNGKFDVEILQYCKSKNECIALELQLIQKYHDIGLAQASHQDKRGIALTDEQKVNISNGLKGRKLSEEHKEKLRQIGLKRVPPFKGRTHTTESKKKIGESLKGRKLSDFQRQRIIESNKTRKISNETREKMRQSAKNRKNRSKSSQGVVIQLITNEIFHFNSRDEAFLYFKDKGFSVAQYIKTNYNTDILPKKYKEYFKFIGYSKFFKVEI